MRRFCERWLIDRFAVSEDAAKMFHEIDRRVGRLTLTASDDAAITSNAAPTISERVDVFIAAVLVARE